MMRSSLEVVAMLSIRGADREGLLVGHRTRRIITEGKMGGLGTHRFLVRRVFA